MTLNPIFDQFVRTWEWKYGTIAVLNSDFSQGSLVKMLNYISINIIFSVWHFGGGALRAILRRFEQFVYAF